MPLPNERLHTSGGYAHEICMTHKNKLLPLIALFLQEAEGACRVQDTIFFYFSSFPSFNKS